MSIVPDVASKDSTYLSNVHNRHQVYWSSTYNSLYRPMSFFADLNMSVLTKIVYRLKPMQVKQNILRSMNTSGYRIELVDIPIINRYTDTSKYRSLTFRHIEISISEISIFDTSIYRNIDFRTIGLRYIELSNFDISKHRTWEISLSFFEDLDVPVTTDMVYRFKPMQVKRKV